MRRRGATTLLFIAGLALSLLASYCVASRAYTLARAYTEHGQTYVSDEIYYVDTARRYLQYIFKININYYNYSNKTGSNYYNLEHPPLGKYIIALSMLACGDKPLCWRLPGIIEASLIPVILYVAVAADSRNKRILPIIAGVIASLGVAGDKILYIDASVAMLDIHLAFFTALTLALATRRRYVAALVAGALASTVKMSGLAAVGGVTGLLFLDRVARRDYRDALRIIALAIVLTALVWILVYIPLMLKFTPLQLLDETGAALRWHTTSRPPGPPTATPPGWILNTNPFPFSFSGVLARAETTSALELAALSVSVLLVLLSLYMVARRRAMPRIPGSTTYAATLLLYAAVYLLGNHTLYSFYAVQLAPPAGLALAELILVVVPIVLGLALPHANEVLPSGGAESRSPPVKERGKLEG